MIDDEIARLKALYRPLMKALSASHEEFTNRLPIDYKAHKKASLALKAFGDLPCPERAEEYQRLYDASRRSQAQTFKVRSAMDLDIHRLDQIGEPLQALEGFRRIVRELEGLGHEPKTMLVIAVRPSSFDDEPEVRHRRNLHRDLHEYGSRVWRFGYKIAELI